MKKDLKTKFREHRSNSYSITYNTYVSRLDKLVECVSDAQHDETIMAYRSELIKLLDLDPFVNSKIANAFSQKLGEAFFYHLCVLKNIKIEKIPETNFKTPDFRCSLECGTNIFFEVKTLSIVDGERGIENHISNGLDLNIYLEDQMKAGRNTASGSLISQPYGEKVTYSNAISGIISVISEKIKNNIKSGQFKNKNTFLVVNLAVLHNAFTNPGELCPVYCSDGRPVSGIFWMVAFRENGMLVFRESAVGCPAIESKNECSGILIEHEEIAGIIFITNDPRVHPEAWGLFRKNDLAQWEIENPEIWETVFNLVDYRYNDSESSYSCRLNKYNRDFAANKRFLMGFEWNPQKAELSSRKHGVTFEEAASVFADFLSTTYPDPEHSIQEERYIIIGLSSKNRVLVIAHAYRGKTIRIISARPATKRERNFYEHGL